MSKYNKLSAKNEGSSEPSIECHSKANDLDITLQYLPQNHILVYYLHR